MCWLLLNLTLNTHLLAKSRTNHPSIDTSIHPVLFPLFISVSVVRHIFSCNGFNHLLTLFCIFIHCCVFLIKAGIYCYATYLTSCRISHVLDVDLIVVWLCNDACHLICQSSRFTIIISQVCFITSLFVSLCLICSYLLVKLCHVINLTLWFNV